MATAEMASASVSTFQTFDPVVDAQQQMARIATSLHQRRDWLDEEIDKLVSERGRVEGVIAQLEGNVATARTVSVSGHRRYAIPTTIDKLNLTQQQILTLLTERGPMTGPQIDAALDVQTFSNYAGPMVKAGLLARKRLPPTNGRGCGAFIYAVSAEQLQ